MKKERKGIIHSIQDLYHETIMEFYYMGLQAGGKTFDEVFRDQRGAKFWSQKNTRCRTFGKKLRRLMKEAS